MASMAIDQTPPPMLCTPTRLPFKSSGVRILRRSDEIAVGFIDDAGEKRHVKTAGRRADHGTGNRVSHLNIAGHQRGHGLRAAADVDDFDVDAMLAETFLARHRSTSPAIYSLKAPWAMRTSGSSAADKLRGRMHERKQQITDDNSVTTNIPLMWIGVNFMGTPSTARTIGKGSWSVKRG